MELPVGRRGTNNSVRSSGDKDDARRAGFREAARPSSSSYAPEGRAARSTWGAHSKSPSPLRIGWPPARSITRLIYSASCRRAQLVFGGPPMAAGISRNLPTLPTCLLTWQQSKLALKRALLRSKRKVEEEEEDFSAKILMVIIIIISQRCVGAGAGAAGTRLNRRLSGLPALEPGEQRHFRGLRSPSN